MCADDARDRIGVLGGTFDPVHLGHVASAQEVLRAYDLDRVLLVLSARPPHKPDHEPASVEDRMAMLRLATATTPLIEACDLETRRAGPSFTVDTLQQLTNASPNAALFLILGIDAYREIDTWHRPGALLELANVIVTSRPGTGDDPQVVEPPVAAREACCYDPAVGCYVHRSGHRLLGHRLIGVEVSSSDIRRRVRAGLTVDHLTGVEIALYIGSHHLYEDTAS